MTGERIVKPLIAVDCRMWQSSGIGTYLQNLVPRLVRRMPDVRFALLGDAVRLAAVFDDTVQYCPLQAPIYSLREQWRLAAAVPAGTALFWSPHYNIPLFSSAPLLVTIHDALHAAMPELFPGLLKQGYAALMFRAALKKSRLVLTDSQFTRQELLRLFGSVAAAARMEVVPLGVDQQWFDIVRQPAAGQRPFLLYVGNVKPHKNLRGLVRAFAMVRQRIAVDLLIVGEREGFLTGDAALMTEAAELGERVRFTGRVSLEELQRYYAQALALVLPSHYEGFGLTVLEAMAAGCPVICSHAASLPEVGGDAAVYFDPYNDRELAESLLRVAEDPELRQQLQLRGALQARRFSWDRTAALTEALIRRQL